MKNKTIIFSLIFISILFYTLWWAYRYAIDSPLRIPTEEAKRRLAKNQFDLILDVRTDAEVKTLGSYPGSIHIPAANVEKEMPAKYPNTSISILLYCNSGQRSRAAAEKLQKMGYKNAVYYAGPYQTLI